MHIQHVACVLQCIVEWCSVLQCVAVWCLVLQFVAVYHSVLQCVVLLFVAVALVLVGLAPGPRVWYISDGMLQYVAVRCSMLCAQTRACV